MAAVAAAASAGLISNGQIASAGGGGSKHHEQQFTDEFFLQDCNFTSTGTSRFFILEPNYQSVLAGEEDGEDVQLTVTMKNETKVVNGAETRVVEERETRDGELEELSDNYFAICEQTNSLFYFGEDVQFYENGQRVAGGEEES